MEMSLECSSAKKDKSKSTSRNYINLPQEAYPKLNDLIAKISEGNTQATQSFITETEEWTKKICQRIESIIFGRKKLNKEDIDAARLDTLIDVIDVIKTSRNIQNWRKFASCFEDKLKIRLKNLQKSKQKIKSIHEIEDAETSQWLSENNGIEEVDDADRYEYFRKLIKIALAMNSKQKTTILLNFGLEDGREHTYKEIGNILELSKTRVQQIREKAIRKLQNFITVCNIEI